MTYQMTDSQGGFSTATVTITVTGINSAPVSTPIAAQSSIDGGSVTLNVSGNFSDPDAGDLLTFSASSLPPGLSINSTTGIISGTINNNASVGGPYSVTITATDIAGVQRRLRHSHGQSPIRLLLRRTIQPQRRERIIQRQCADE